VPHGGDALGAAVSRSVLNRGLEATKHHLRVGSADVVRAGARGAPVVCPVAQAVAVAHRLPARREGALAREIEAHALADGDPTTGTAARADERGKCLSRGDLERCLAAHGRRIEPPHSQPGAASGTGPQVTHEPVCAGLELQPQEREYEAAVAE
jgi:hypothetical protein